MKGLGVFTLVIAALAAIVAIVVAVVSVPDVKRYLKMRQM
jgi:hypothetical protein